MYIYAACFLHTSLLIFCLASFGLIDTFVVLCSLESEGNNNMGI